MVLALAAPNKRRRIHTLPSNTSHDNDHHHVPTSRSSSPATGAQASAFITSSHSLPHNPSSTQHRCDICFKTFARHEHMLRHRASHTDAASFTCDDCGKRFRRSDVLQRHRRLHIVRKELCLSPNNTKLTTRQRSALARVEAACLRCSSKKLKCDAAKPSCSRCLRKTGVNCVYPAASDSSPTSSKPRNSSTSLMDDSCISDSHRVHLAPSTTSPIPCSTPYPAQAQSLSPTSLSAVASSIGSSASLADISSAHHPHHHHSAASSHHQQFQSNMPACILPDSTHLPISATSVTPRSFQSTSCFAHQLVDSHTVGIAQSLAQMIPTPVPPPNPPALHDDRTLEDLLGWLDGPKPHQPMHVGQIDWIFGDSPEAPPLLDWNQMHDWANFDLATQASHPVPIASSLTAPTLQDLQPAPSAHQRQVSMNQANPSQCSLFVLSSAAEIVDFHQHSPQIGSQHIASINADASLPASTTLPGDGSPCPANTKQQSGVSVDARPTLGGRSRWNTPDLVDEEIVSNDSVKSGSLDTKHDVDSAQGADVLSVPQPKSWSQRRAAAMQAWPNRWNPSMQENSLPDFTFTRASEEHLMSEDMAHVKQVSHTAMVRMAEHLKIAATNPLEEERFDASFATLDAATLNVYLQLFFHHCYSYLPAIHQVTFHPDRCDPRLLASLCAVGAFFSEVPGSRNAAIYLASLTQMSLGFAIKVNFAYARMTSTFQSILLVHTVWRSVGVPSRQEYSEAFRATYCTMIRRCRLLENISPPKLPAEAKIEDRWKAWVAWESGRRTAWSTLVSETELSVHWSLPEPFAPDELTGKLPCDDRLWEAPSAIEWAQTATMLSSISRGLVAESNLSSISVTSNVETTFIWPDSSYQLDVPRACDIIQRTAQYRSPNHPCSVTEQDREALARLSPFSRLCVGSAIMLSTHHAIKMVRFCPMLLGDEEQARGRMRTYLATATDLLSTNQARDARVDLLLHAIQLFELVSPEMLQLLSCRRGVPRMHAAQRQLAKELNETKPWKTASLVFHAGQMLRLAKQSLQRAPVECLNIFYAAIALQAVSLLVLQKDAHAQPGHIVRIAFNGPARSAAPQTSNSTFEPGSTRPWRANSTASIASSTSHSSVGGACSTSGTSFTSTTPTEGRAAVKMTFMLESVGNLAHPMAPERVLSLASKWLRADDGVGVWPIGQSLAKILDSLATLIPRQSGAT